jgi:hypothetical protein
MNPLQAPPSGVGCYARDHSVDELVRHGWAFVCLNGERTDAEPKARELAARGVAVFFWSGPGSWRPSEWEREILRMRGLVQRTGARGFIADPEMYWDQVDDGAHVGAAFGRAMADAASECSVGITSYPAWRRDVLRAFAAETRGRVWCTPQIYGRTSAQWAELGRDTDHNGTPDTIADIHEEWFRQWAELFGRGMTIPSVAGWVAHGSLGDGPGFRAYLAAMPRAQGAIAFLTSGGGPPAHILEGLRGYNPSGSMLARPFFLARGWLSSRGGQIATIAIVVFAVLAFGAWRAAHV